MSFHVGILIGFSLFVQSAYGYAGNNQVCATGTGTPEVKTCDPSKLLSCLRNGLCGCDGNSFYSYERDRCLVYVESTCTNDFGSPGGGDGQHGGNKLVPECAPGSACDSRGTKRCVCKSDCKEYANKTACVGATHCGNSAGNLKGFLPLTFTLILTYLFTLPVFK